MLYGKKRYLRVNDQNIQNKIISIEKLIKFDKAFIYDLKVGLK